MTSYSEWVKNVPYGLKKVTQKNSIDFYMRNHWYWISITDENIRTIENYTGKTFGVHSPRRSFTNCLNKLVEEGIIVVRKFNGKRYYRHSIFGTFIDKNCIWSDYDDSEYSNSDDSDDANDSEYSNSDQSDDPEQPDDPREDVNSDIEIKCDNKLSKKTPKSVYSYNNYIGVSECNVFWKRTKTQEEEDEEDDIREMERYVLERKIMVENRVYKEINKSTFRLTNFLGVISITSIITLCLTQSSFMLYI